MMPKGKPPPHALLRSTGQHQWYTVEGGSVGYVARLERAMRARGVDIRAGTGGGALNAGNYAGILAGGDQQLNVGAGGLLIQAGGGTGEETDNEAFVDGAMSLAGSYQRLYLTGGGGITLLGGNSAKVDVGGFGHGSRARIQAGTGTVSASDQLIDFQGGGTLSLTGGSAGSRAFALIFAEGTASQ